MMVKMTDKNTLRVYILVRKDIKVTAGKLMVHVGHVVSNVVYKNTNINIKRWFNDNHTIIILSVEDLIKMKYFITILNIKHPKIHFCMIVDAGFHEVEQGTILMCGMGPMTKKQGNSIGLNKLSPFNYDE